MVETEFDLDAYKADESLFAQCPPEDEVPDETVGDLEPRPEWADEL